MKKTAFCLDFDGTLTKQEVLPLLSKEVGIYEEMQALTNATINGFLEFESSFKLRVRLLRSIPIHDVQKIIRKVEIHKKLLSFLHSISGSVFIITGNLDVWLKAVVQDLNLHFFCSEAEVVNGELVGIKKIINKGSVINELKETFDRIVVVGEGMNDNSMFSQADIKIAFGAVHQPVQTIIENSDYIVYEEESLCRLLKMLL